MKTHAKILEAAKLLFNEFGVPQTSLRDIAKKIDISQGNLTYHFPKKEIIFEELYFDFVDRIKAEALIDETSNISMKTFISHTRERMNIMLDYRFLFIDLNHTLREYPKIKQHFNQLGIEQLQAYQSLFKLAIDHDIMRGQAYKDEYTGLACRVKMFNDHWISAAQAQNESFTDSAGKYHDLLTEMLFPYFTKDAQREFLLNRL